MSISFAEGIAALTLHDRLKKPAALKTIGPAPLPQYRGTWSPIETRMRARRHRQMLSKEPEYAFLRGDTASLSQAFEVYVYEVLRGTE